MRHRVYGKHLGRDIDQRNSLFRSLLRSLISHGSLQTSQTKSQAIKGVIDKLINAGKKNTDSAKRVVLSTLASEDLSKKLIEEIAPKYSNRNSGFTKVVKLGRRAGDGTMMVKMSLIEEKAETKKELIKEENIEEVKEEKPGVKVKKESKAKKA